MNHWATCTWKARIKVRAKAKGYFFFHRQVAQRFSVQDKVRVQIQADSELTFLRFGWNMFYKLKKFKYVPFIQLIKVCSSNPISKAKHVSKPFLWLVLKALNHQVVHFCTITSIKDTYDQSKRFFTFHMLKLGFIHCKCT